VASDPGDAMSARRRRPKGRAEWLRSLEAQTLTVQADMLYPVLVLAAKSLATGYAHPGPGREAFEALREQFLSQCGDEQLA